MSTEEQTIAVGDIVWLGKTSKHQWRVWVIDGEYARIATFSGHLNRRALISNLRKVDEP